MGYEWIDAFLLELPGCEKDFKAEWNATRYMLKGKMFAMDTTDKNGKPIITLKLEPARGELLRKEYPGSIVPGYYMNKQHWSSLYTSTHNVPDNEVESMCAESHSLILKSLPKKAQAEILG